jgi:hypothetical protein
LHGWGQWTYSKLSKLEFSRFAVGEISDETYEQLRRILEKQNGHSYTLEEVKEIGDGLMGFFNILKELDAEIGD